MILLVFHSCNFFFVIFALLSFLLFLVSELRLEDLTFGCYFGFNGAFKAWKGLAVVALHDLSKSCAGFCQRQFSGWRQ